MLVTIPATFFVSEELLDDIDADTLVLLLTPTLRDITERFLHERKEAREV